MLKFLLKLAGFLALAGAFAQIVVDGARSIAGGALMLTPLGALVEALAPGRVAAWGEGLAAYSPFLEGAVAAMLDTAPAALALTALACVLLAATRPKRDAGPSYEGG